MSKVLVISPHSDDELFGVGGTLLRHKKNKDKIFGLLLCDRGKKYVEEYKQGMRRMGAQKVFWEHYLDCKFETYPVKDLADSIMRVIDEIRPDRIYVPAVSIHQDHKAVNDACLICFRPTSPFIPKEILEYENATYEFGIGRGFNPRYFVDISEFVKEKQRIYDKYYSSHSNKPDEHLLSTKNIEFLAKYRGMQSRTAYAEAFQILRMVE
ncbi:MAG: PIG-L family deacetylase [Nanoarchaeota archaeon]|nr:PIG-L family deacetylase [Nanoarchaeota archaeon]